MIHHGVKVVWMPEELPPIPSRFTVVKVTGAPVLLVDAATSESFIVAGNPLKLVPHIKGTNPPWYDFKNPIAI